jgi:hypothetical protein
MWNGPWFVRLSGSSKLHLLQSDCRGEGGLQMKNSRIDVVVGIGFFVGLLSSFAGTMYFAFIRDAPLLPPPFLDAIGIILSAMVLAGPGYAYLTDLKLTARLLNLLAVWVLAAGFLFLDRYREAMLLLTGLILIVSASYQLAKGWMATPMNQSTSDKRAT